MSYAIALPHPGLEYDTNEIKKINPIFNSKKTSILFKKIWIELSEENRNKLAPLKLYDNLKNKKFVDTLQTLKRIENSSVVKLVRDYVWKRNNPFFNLKEKIKSLLNKSTEYNLLEQKLVVPANQAYSLYGDLLREKSPVITKLERKYLKDLTKAEREEIVLYRMYKYDVEKLVRNFYLQNKSVVYRAVSHYNQMRKKECISKIKKFLEIHDYKAREVLYLANKVKRKTFGKLTCKEKAQISWWNKHRKTKAQDLVKKFGLSGKHVVYLVNRWRREQTKAKEQMINQNEERTSEPEIIKLPTTYHNQQNCIYSA